MYPRHVLTDGDMSKTAASARINYMKTLLYIHLEESPVS